MNKKTWMILAALVVVVLLVLFLTLRPHGDAPSAENVTPTESPAAAPAETTAAQTPEAAPVEPNPQDEVVEIPEDDPNMSGDPFTPLDIDDEYVVGSDEGEYGHAGG